MEQRILPGELAILVAFVFTPPLLIAFVFEAWFFSVRSRPSALGRSRFLVAYGLTVLGSVALGVALMAFVPPWLGPIFGIRDAWIGHLWFPIAPAAYIAVAVVALLMAVLLAPRREGLTSAWSRPA